MSRINSKNKGSTFERKTAKILSDWSGVEFNRTPGSGSLHWKSDNNVTGDIVAPAEIKFPISIECKKHEIDWEIDKLITGTSTLWSFWNQAVTDSMRHKPKEPCLIFTKNRRSIYIMINFSFYKKLITEFPDLDKIPHLNISINNVIILDFYKFLENVKFKKLIRMNL